MNINKKELKKTSHAFRSAASRLLNAHYADFTAAIKLFMQYIDTTPLIKNYIESLPATGLNLEQEFSGVISDLGDATFELGNSKQAETVNIYNIPLLSKINSRMASAV